MHTVEYVDSQVCNQSSMQPIEYTTEGEVAHVSCIHFKQMFLNWLRWNEHFCSPFPWSSLFLSSTSLAESFNEWSTFDSQLSRFWFVLVIEGLRVKYFSSKTLLSYSFTVMEVCCFVHRSRVSLSSTPRRKEAAGSHNSKAKVSNCSCVGTSQEILKEYF